MTQRASYLSLMGFAKKFDHRAAGISPMGLISRGIQSLTALVQRYNVEGIPDQRKTPLTFPIRKKDDQEDLRTYRLICLLSVLYKVFTKK
ncbi:hypothetical protein RB195_011839 [Necator americanus]|uniref:Uncharacterized protein n=1 Tax=Necator americanus TaxID=51031 RepID=A0ABR1D499_NECAM